MNILRAGILSILVMVSVVLVSPTPAFADRAVVVGDRNVVVSGEGKVDLSTTVQNYQLHYHQIDPAAVAKVVNQEATRTIEMNESIAREVEATINSRLGAIAKQLRAVDQLQAKQDLVLKEVGQLTDSGSERHRELTSGINEQKAQIQKVRQLVTEENFAQADRIVAESSKSLDRLQALKESLAIESRRSTRQLVAIAMGGLALTTLAIGGYMGVSAQAAYSDSRAYCNERSFCTQQGVDLRDQAHNRAAVANVLVVGSAAILVGAAVVWFTAPAAPSERSARSDRGGIALRAAPDSVGLTLFGAL